MVGVERFLGVDLAWGEGRDGGVVNETGLVCLDRSGQVLAAGLARGVADTLTWILILADGRIVAEGSADRLARQLSSRAEVRWSRDGERFVHATDDATGLVRELFALDGDTIADLEVRRPNLEDAYLAMVRRFESGQPRQAVTFQEADQ